MASLGELKLDIEELEVLLGQASRQKVKDILSLQVRKLQTDYTSLLEKETRMEVSEPKDAAPVSAKPKKYTKDLDTYGWDQSEKFLKIYVTLTGVHKIPKDSVSCEYQNKSFKMLVKDLDNKNYQLHVAHLYDSIIPEQSYHKVKTDMVLLMLKKSEQKTWAYVTEKASDKKKPPKIDENKDPQEGLMDLLKKMYDEGDDDMKRTIAKSMAESRNKSPAL